MNLRERARRAFQDKGGKLRERDLIVLFSDDELKQLQVAGLIEPRQETVWMWVDEKDQSSG